MAKGNAVSSTRTFHRPIARGENDAVALICVDHFSAGLRAWNIFDENELAAIPISVSLAEHDDQLQRKCYLPVQILMQAVVAACFVMQQKRRGLLLAGFVTACEKLLVVERK